MILRMASPWKHPDTGVYYLRERPPAELLPRVRGQRLSLTVCGKPVMVTIGEVVKVSLRTKDRGEAKERYRDVARQVANRLQSFGDEGVTLSHAETIHLAGDWCRTLIAQYRANPGDPEGWDEELWRVGEALEHFVPDNDPDFPPDNRAPFNPERGEALLAKYLNPDPFPQAQGLRLSPASRLAFLRAAAHAHMMACRTLRRNAEGDYAPDPALERFPKEPFKRQSGDPGADIWGRM